MILECGVSAPLWIARHGEFSIAHSALPAPKVKAMLRHRTLNRHICSLNRSQAISSISGCKPSGGQRSKRTLGHCSLN